MILESIIALQMFGWPQLPPARFDHPPKYGMYVDWVDYPTLVATCRNVRAAACAFAHKKAKCRIVANQGYRGTWAEPGLIRHERGHCNWWTAAHEQ